MFAEDGPVLKFLEPFISEPIGFDRFIDVSVRNGKKDGGGSVYTQSDDLGDKFIKSLGYVLDGVKPGIVSSGQKIGDALSNDLTKGGKPMNLMNYWPCLLEHGSLELMLRKTLDILHLQ